MKEKEEGGPTVESSSRRERPDDRRRFRNRGYYTADGFLDLGYALHRMHREVAASVLDVFADTMRRSNSRRDGYYYNWGYDPRDVGDGLGDLADTFERASESVRDEGRRRYDESKSKS